MGNPIYVIAYDVGTTGVKTCLFSITDKIELLGAASEGYNLYVYPDGGAEQEPSTDPGPDEPDATDRDVAAPETEPVASPGERRA